MCVIRLWLSFVLVLSALPLWGVDGTFEGRILPPPKGQAAAQPWLYVQGGNHLVRRVDVSHAEILLGRDAGATSKRKCNVDCLTPGQEVRVIAEVDAAGEWRAKRVEILKGD